MAHKEEKEIGAISWRLLDNPGEWHYTVPCTYILINPFAPGDFAEKHISKLVEWFSGHCPAIKS